VHVPVYIGAGALILGIVILRTARGDLAEAERVQAESVTVPAPRMVPVGPAATGNGVIIAAVDDSPVAERVTATAGRLAAVNGRAVHVLHAQEHASTSEATADGEAPEAAAALVRAHLERLTAAGVPAVGHVLLNATDHGAVGRLISEHADTIAARAVVIGAPTHGGLPALMDASASKELWRTVHCDVVIVNPVDERVPAQQRS
jgi:ACDE family multidrug resistance protein